MAFSPLTTSLNPKDAGSPPLKRKRYLSVGSMRMPVLFAAMSKEMDLSPVRSMWLREVPQATPPVWGYLMEAEPSVLTSVSRKSSSPSKGNQPSRLSQFERVMFLVVTAGAA